MHRRYAYPLFIFPFLLALLLPAARVTGAETGDYLRELQASARERTLHDDRYWDILLHYRRGWFGRESLVDDRRFFLSPTGKKDPASELAATLAGFLQEPTRKQTVNEEEEQLHPRCRFPARFEWLKQRLSIDASRLPEVSCGEFDNAIQQINPKSASLIFASAHMNAPASMFGHTLLRVDSAYRSPLLSYAVNYAATIDRRDNGLVYAFKGIFGLYPGYYSILPYYEKVKEYANMDQRDLWEYRLNLTEEEVRRMVFHMWEFQGIFSDYFFFDENCSYNLLFLLEAARPAVSLTDRKGAWIIPIDTLKGVLKANLVEDAVFRPSQARQIRHAASQLDGEKRGMARAVIDGTLPPEDLLGLDIPREDKVRILDIASEYTQLRYTQKRLPKEAFQERFVGMLGTRSRMEGAAPSAPPLSMPERPESGHAASRGSLSAGVRDRKFFQEISYRPAYHELMDPESGFTEGSQIEFAAATLRYYPKDEKLRLQRLDVINIFSAAARDEFFQPVSWKIRAGIAAKEFASGEDGTVVTLSPGGGFAWKSRFFGLTYLLLETELDYSRGYEKDYAAGVGLTMGTLKTITDSWKVLAQARYIAGVLGDTRRGQEFSATLRQGVPLLRYGSLFFDLERTVSPGIRDTEAKVSWNFYF